MSDLKQIKDQLIAAGEALKLAAAAIETDDTDQPPPELSDGYVSPHFKQTEFACNHCGEIHPSDPTPPQEVLDWLEDIRAHFGGPVNVNSGYRCPTHNANVGGATNSYHMKGMAVDFWLPHVSPSEVYAYADQIVGSKGGVGKYDSFTHIDNRGFAARW